MTFPIDVLIPTYNRPAALAVTLTSLVSQTFRRFRVIVSDQTEVADVADSDEIKAVVRVLRSHGNPVHLLKHLPRRGMAEQRQYLLDQARAPHVLFLDDDVILESFVIENMFNAIKEEGCGFVGAALVGLSYIKDVRPKEQAITFWEGPVRPEVVYRGSEAWERWPLHNAANLYHVQQRLHLSADNPKKYRVAWVGGCVLYDAAKLRDVGGFDFWPQLPPEHSGEDVLAQLRVLARYGGCGLVPSGVYHQELPTTIVDRRIDAHVYLDWNKRMAELLSAGVVLEHEPV